MTIAPATERLMAGLCLLLFLGLGFLPHQAMLHMLFPVDLLGKNLWLIIPLVMASGVLAVALMIRGERALKFNFSCAMLVWIAGVWGGLYWDQARIAEVLINSRPLLLLPLAVLGGRSLSSIPGFAKGLLLLVVAQGAFQAIIGLVHIHFFPEVVTGTFAYLRGVPWFVTEEWRLFTSRESGTLGNPSAYAEMIGLAAFAVCLYLARYRRNGPKWFVVAIALGSWVLFVSAVIPSLSRVVVVFVSAPYLALMACMLHTNGMKGTRPLMIAVAAILCLMATLAMIKYPQLLERFRTEGMFGRTQKNAMLLGVLTFSPEWWGFGIPSQLVADLRTPEGTWFGDNSYLRLAAACGFPITIVWMMLMVWIGGSVSRSISASSAEKWLYVVLHAYVLILLFLGDVLFNDGWMMLAILLMTLRAMPIQDSAVPVLVSEDKPASSSSNRKEIHI